MRGVPGYQGAIGVAAVILGALQIAACTGDSGSGQSSMDDASDAPLRPDRGESGEGAVADDAPFVGEADALAMGLEDAGDGTLDLGDVMVATPRDGSEETADATDEGDSPGHVDADAADATIEAGPIEAGPVDAGPTDATIEADSPGTVDADATVETEAPGTVDADASDGSGDSQPRNTYIDRSTGQILQSIEGPECLSCASTDTDVMPNCLGQLNCEALAGHFNDAGQSREDLCKQLLGCILSTHCANETVTTCYCGTADISSCFDASNANGMCKEEEELALETTDPLQILVLHPYDTTRGGGMANGLVHCLPSTNCSSCFQ
jgi:hypothetical protein